MQQIYRRKPMPKCHFNKNGKQVGMGDLLSICYIFSEHLFLSTPMEGYFWLFYSAYLPTVQIFKRGCCLFYFLYFFFINQTILSYFPLYVISETSKYQTAEDSKKVYQLLRHDLRDSAQTHKRTTVARIHKIFEQFFIPIQADKGNYRVKM